MEKSCDNCRAQEYACIHKCDPTTMEYWQPDYQTLIIEQIEQIAKEREYSQKLQAQILNRYNELFKNYTFTDCETAIDLMAGEIQVLRAKLEQYKEALEVK